jgi:ArsR family transcriptional regulator
VDELISVGKAFADATRVRILAAVRNRELCVCELCDALDVTQSTLSTHLQVIRDAGLVNTRKQGKWVYYSLNPKVTPLLESIFDFFDRGLKANRTIQSDARKLARRLNERKDGACCVGFGASTSDRKTCTRK